MNKLELLKFICSNDSLHHLKNNLLEAQRIYYNNNIEYTKNFSPIRFFANNIKEIIKDPLCSLSYHKMTYSKIPKYMYLNNYCVMIKGSFDKDCEINICRYYLDHSNRSWNWSFDELTYWNQYHKLIKLQYSSEDIIDNSLRFYIEHGSWYNLEPRSIDGLQHIASHQELITSIGPNCEEGIKNYFNCPKEFSFNPLHYIVSNWDRLKELALECSELNIDKATYHYITIGYKEKLSVDSFNIYKYLANNEQRIHELLSDENNNIDWNFLKITVDEVCLNYIKHKGKANWNTFNTVEFAKEYVDDLNVVNKDVSLTVKNADFYFVKYYIKCKKVRHKSSYLYKMKKFMYERIQDTAKQVPLNFGRYVLQKTFF